MLMEYHLNPFLLPALLDLQNGLKNHDSSGGICAATVDVQILFDIIYHYFFDILQFSSSWGVFFFQSILQCTN